MFSHSNDFSAKRHIQDGWKIIFKIAYRDLPDHLVMDSSINGHLNVCYRQFN